MTLSTLLATKDGRDNLREKFEVIMAVVTLTAFVYRKYQKSQGSYIDVTSFGQEK